MTEKEKTRLLFFSSMAAGLKFKSVDSHMGVHLTFDDGSFFKYFNPLNDDDSVLFLARKLKIDIKWSEIKNDDYRLYIVERAAEIGMNL